MVIGMAAHMLNDMKEVRCTSRAGRYHQGSDCQLQVPRSFNRERNLCGESDIHTDPLREIHIPRSDRVKAVHLRFETCSECLVIHDQGFRRPCLSVVHAERELIPNAANKGKRRQQIYSIRQGKHRVCPSSDEKPLDGWSKYRSEHSRDSPYRCPSIPVNRTRAAEPPALANTIKHRHFTPSLSEPILP